MATKAEERKALEQIRKIVEGLGEGSYISIAMEGMFEDAEENINNDFGVSMKDRWQTAEQACDLRRAEVRGLEIENEKLKKDIEGWKRQNDSNYTLAQENEEDCKHWMRKCEEGKKAFEELNHQNSEMLNQIADMEVEIMKLKAKLYDLMTK